MEAWSALTSFTVLGLAWTAACGSDTDDAGGGGGSGGSQRDAVADGGAG